MPGTSIVAKSEPAERHLSWGEVDWLIETAVAKMRQEFKYRPKRIIPIGGGGIIPAAIMAYRFYKKDGIPVRLMKPIYASSYDDRKQQHGLQISWPDWVEQVDMRSTLIVDDIVDTGATWHAVRAKMPNSLFFALVTKIVGQPHICATLDTQQQWWHFPWEKIPQEPKG